MKYMLLLIAASITILGSVDVFTEFTSRNFEQDNLVSCRRSKDEPPVDSTSDRSGA